MASNLSAGLYTATLSFTNLNDHSVRTRQVTLAIFAPPFITSQPTNQAVLQGMTTAFSVGTASNALLSYQWQYDNGAYATNLSDGGNLSGSTTSTLTVRDVSPGNAGTYSVIISNAAGSVTSAGATLTVLTGQAPVVVEVLYSFTTDANGFNPWGGLCQANDGNFYGTASAGSPQGWGTVFRMATNGVVTALHAFTDGNDGSIPLGALIQGTNGLLYGTTLDASAAGTVFSITTNGSLRSYALNGSSSGASPRAALAQGRDGNFYGTASQGGPYRDIDPYSYGTIFKLTPSGALTALGAFNSDDGTSPGSTLVQGVDGNMYGTAQNGGTNGGWGTVFKITPSGTLNALFSFANINGAFPVAGLVQDTDGNLYGTTYSGGTSNAGTVFKLTADGAFTSLYSFTGGTDGGNCYAGLLLASDGNLYGATENGGAYGLGTIFRISPDGGLVTQAHFDGYQGANPEGTLIQGNDGALYGTTLNGGAAGYGAIFRLSFDAPLQITGQPHAQTAFAGDTVHFTVATFGSLPVSYQWLKGGTNLVDGANLAGANARVLILTNVEVPDAALYSVIVSNTYGSLTSAAAQLEVILSPPSVLAGPEDQTALAGSPVSFEVQAGGDGPLSYQWQQDGTNLVDGAGVSGSTTSTLRLGSVTAASAGIYSVIVSNALSSVPSGGATLSVLPVLAPGVAWNIMPAFGSGTNAFNPYAGLVQGSDGYLYGTTVNGGTERFGTAFKVSPANAFTPLYSFTNGPDGANPFAGLIQAADGNFYGAAFQGVTASFGTLFKMTPAGAVTPLYGFTGGDDGGNPLGSLVQGRDGALYGTASTGGSNGFGAVFSLTTNGVFAPVWSFHSSIWSFHRNDGSSPTAPLVQGSSGTLYGTTATGGSNHLGTVFRLTTDGTFSSLVSFDYAQGAYPSNGLVVASDGGFYGTTSAGGTNGGWGTIFRLSADGTLSTLHCFNYQDGAVPVGGLVQGTDGNLYGTTSQGGVGGNGTVFQITTNGMLRTLVWFNGSNGANPQSTLVQARNGYFYGTAEFGGSEYDGANSSGDGLIFRFALSMFLSNPFVQADATVGTPYIAALSTNAVLPAPNAATFAKVSGPAWLTIASDGSLTGMPTVSDVGTNSFTVSLADTNGWASIATMRIAVVPAPLFASLSISQGTNLVLSWSGGLPPYQVQMANDLVYPAWQNIGGQITNSSLFLAPANAAAFYRIQGQ